MRIGFLAGGLGQGGAEKQLCLSVEALSTAGHDVRVLAFEHGINQEHLKRLGCIPKILPPRTSRMGQIAAVRRWARDNRLQVLQAAHTWMNPYVVCATLGLRVLAIGAVRSDGAYELAQNPVWSRLSLGLPSTLITNSQVAATVAHRFDLHRGRRIYVVPNAIHTVEASTPPKPANLVSAPDQRPVVLTIANLTSAKRLDLLIEAFGTLGDLPNPPPMLWIVGDGPEREGLETLARRFDPDGDSIRFLGRRTDVRHLFHRAAIFALTSDSEGFPNTVLEAMAHGAAVVATRAGGVPDLLIDRETGLLADKGDVVAISAHIREVLADHALRAALSDAAKRYVTRAHSVERLGENLQAIYEQGLALNNRSF